MGRWNIIIANAVATLCSWLAVAIVRVFAGSGSDTTGFAIVIAFLTTIAIWITWAFVIQGVGDTESVASEKTKRDAGGTDRLGLLLDLLSEDERQALKQRLIDGLQTDGETITLAELIAAQEEKAGQHHAS